MANWPLFHNKTAHQQAAGIDIHKNDQHAHERKIDTTLLYFIALRSYPYLMYLTLLGDPVSESMNIYFIPLEIRSQFSSEEVREGDRLKPREGHAIK